MKQGLNEVDHRFLTFFALVISWFGNAQSELKGDKFQRLGTFVFEVLAVRFCGGRNVSKPSIRGHSFDPIYRRYGRSISKSSGGGYRVGTKRIFGNRLVVHRIGLRQSLGGWPLR